MTVMSYVTGLLPASAAAALASAYVSYGPGKYLKLQQAHMTA
jgi:hypothetical protein